MNQSPNIREVLNRPENLRQEWRAEYHRLGTQYARRSAWIVALSFPSIILANLHLISPDHQLLYILSYLFPSVCIAIGALLWRNYRFSHEWMVGIMFMSVFAASSIRTDENTLIIYLIVNAVSFIASSAQMIIFPFINWIFLAYVILLHLLVAEFMYQVSPIAYFTQNGGLVLLVLGFVFVGVNQLRYRILRANFINSLALKQSYELLEKKSQIIEENAQQLEEQNRDITSSINYAKRIQQAVLPPQEHIDFILPRSFIFYEPRDIVSGDFYWVYPLKEKTNQNQVLVAAVDCTGHGVPGAFMSMIGYSFLNQIVNAEYIFEPDQILNRLDENIQTALRQEETGNWDGMDVSMVKLDFDQEKITYAGAKNPLYWIKSGELNMIKADKFSIGGSLKKGKEKIFTPHNLDLDHEAVYYLFSDGYQDQFGGPKGKKLTVGRFRKVLLEASTQDIHQQKAYLQKHLKDWMGDEAQIDDLLIIGLKP